MFNRFLSRFQPDGFVLALIGTVAGLNLFAVSGNECRNFSRARVACRCRVVLFAGGATFARGAGRGSGALATARGDNLHHFRTVSIARVGPMGGSAACAPAIAVVGSVVCLRSALHRAVLDRLDLDRPRQCRGRSLFGGRVQSGWPVSHPDFVRAPVRGAQKRDQSGRDPANRLAASCTFCRGSAVASVDRPMGGAQ
jgi:hypothetical protein